MLRRHRTPPPHSTPLPARRHSPHRISSHHAPGHSRPSRGTCWECRRGMSAGSADGSRKLGRPRSQAGTGRTGRSPACGRREVSSGRCHLVLHPTPGPVSPSFSSPPGLTRVLTHTELGTQLCCPVSHSLMSVQTWGRGSAKVTAPTQTHPNLVPGVLCMLPLPSIPPQTPTIPNSDPYSTDSLQPVPTTARWRRGRETATWLEECTKQKCAPSLPHDSSWRHSPRPSPACWPWRRAAPHLRGWCRYTPKDRPRIGSQGWC